MKNVYCIRHGTAEHNVLFKEMGEKAYMMIRDSSLTELGQSESKLLGQLWIEKNNIELVIVSPLTRTLQTATNIFKGVNVKMISLDQVKEYPASYENINHRKDRSELVVKYHPIVNFKHLPETDPLWNAETNETLEQLETRVKQVKDFILQRKENNIAIVSHTTYLAYFLYGEIDDYDTQLKHCFPYKLHLKSNATYANK